MGPTCKTNDATDSNCPKTIFSEKVNVLDFIKKKSYSEEIIKINKMSKYSRRHLTFIQAFLSY